MQYKDLRNLALQGRVSRKCQKKWQWRKGIIILAIVIYQAHRLLNLTGKIRRAGLPLTVQPADVA